MCIRDSVRGLQEDFVNGLALDSDGNLYLTGTAYFNESRHDYLTICLLYTSDAADERSSVDLGGRRIIKKKKSIVKTLERGEYKQKQK